MKADIHGYMKEVVAQLGEGAITNQADTVTRYGEHTLPAESVTPSAVLYPRHTQDVQIMVSLANRYKVQIFPISTGQNIGLGSRSPIKAGQVVMDLSRHMNKIIEVNEILGYCVVEPGVTFRAMYDELVRRDSSLMISPTAGPSQGSLLGNALDRGGGGGAAADHFGMVCGMEVVLGNGEVIRTGDGSLDASDALNWHVSKYSFGPALDGLFTQSNYGIVTRIGMWLQRRPPHIEPFFFAVDNDDDLEAAIDLVRPLKQSNFVPTQIRITNDLYLIAAAEANPEYQQTGGREQISDAGRKALQQKYSLGSWNISGALFGASKDAVLPSIERIRKHLERSGKIRFIAPEQAEEIGPLGIARKNYLGIPGDDELKMVGWRPGGGTSWFLPGTPLIGSIVNDFQQRSRAICKEHGLEYMVSNVCGPRFARGVHTLVFNRQNPEESARADACYRALAKLFADRGVFVGRSPTLYQGFHQQQRLPSVNEACNAIKQALDPNGVIAPGKYGIE